MPVLHQICTVNQTVFKTRPDFPSQLRGDIQSHAQIPQTYTGQVIRLHTQRGRGQVRQKMEAQQLSDLKPDSQAVSDALKFLPHYTYRVSLLIEPRFLAYMYLHFGKCCRGQQHIPPQTPGSFITVIMTMV